MGFKLVTYIKGCRGPFSWHFPSIHPFHHPSMARRRQSCGNWSHSVAPPHKAWLAWSPQNLSKCLCDPIHLPIACSNCILILLSKLLLHLAFAFKIIAVQWFKQETCWYNSTHWRQLNFNCFQLDSMIILGRGDSCRYKRTMCIGIMTTMPPVQAWQWFLCIMHKSSNNALRFDSSNFQTNNHSFKKWQT